MVETLTGMPEAGEPDMSRTRACSRKGVPGTRCRLLWLRSKEKGDDTKCQDVSSASSISPPAIHGVEEVKEGDLGRGAGKQGEAAQMFLTHKRVSPSGHRPFPIHFYVC